MRRKHQSTHLQDLEEIAVETGDRDEAMRSRLTVMCLGHSPNRIRDSRLLLKEAGIEIDSCQLADGGVDPIPVRRLYVAHSTKESIFLTP